MTHDAWPVLVLAAALLVANPGVAAEVTGFPDADATSGRFVNILRGLSSLGSETTSFHIEVPAQASFEIGFFDGNTSGKWDAWLPESSTPDQVRFTLYADPQMVGATSQAVATWDGGTMPDDAWFSAPVANHPAALTTWGSYMYNLVVSWQSTLLANEQNNFKLRVEGQLFAPVGGTYGFIGYTPNDPRPWQFAPSTYDGSWHFQVYIPAGQDQVTLWDGDFDRADDTHDLDSPPFPPFPYSSLTQVEGAYPGYPADDASSSSPLLVPPSVYYTLVAPGGAWRVVNDNPSGDKEWERFAVALSGTANPDHVVPSLPAGKYEWLIHGVDGRNTLFVHADYPIYTELPGAIGDYVWFDADGDGQQDDAPEAGIPDVTVELWWDATGDGQSDTLFSSTTTGSTGGYLFEQVFAGTYEVRVVASTLPAGYAPTFDYDGIATPHRAGVDLDVASTTSELDFGYTIQRPVLGQGCTPGYWKQKQHFDSWVKYATGDMFSGVFSVDYAKTLLAALGTGGGQERALGRHAAAALLNSVHPGVNYYYTELEVIQMVQDAFASGDFETAKDLLAVQNEADCPLN